MSFHGSKIWKAGIEPPGVGCWNCKGSKAEESLVRFIQGPGSPEIQDMETPRRRRKKIKVLGGFP